MTGTLEGVRVIIGGSRPATLSSLLENRGAHVAHVPLIAEHDPDDGGRALRTELGRLDRYDWLVVTSVAGAERVGRAAREHPSTRLGAVGTATAQRLSQLADRPVDVVPRRQFSAELVRELHAVAPDPARFLLALADRADPRLPDALVAAGHEVTAITAYRTLLTPPEREAVPDADALLLTSGSTAQSWALTVSHGRLDGHLTDPTPPIVVAIGPSTARVAAGVGLAVSAVASDHSLPGLVDALEAAVAQTGAT